MGDLDWRNLVKPPGVDGGVDMGPLPIAAAEPAPRVGSTPPLPLTSPPSGLGKRTRTDSGVVMGQRKKTRAPLSLRAMRESVGMSRQTPLTTSDAPVVSSPAPASSLPAASNIPGAPPVFSDAPPRIVPIAPVSGGLMPSSGGVPSLLQFPRPVGQAPGGIITPPSSSPLRPSSPSPSQIPGRPSPPRPAIRPPIEHACTRAGERSYWSMGCRPKVGGFLSGVDRDMLSFAGVESSANAGRIFFHRGLAILDCCESKYKAAEAKSSRLVGEADKWKQYARTVYKVERPRFLDSALAFATAAKANYELASKFDDAFAKLMETRLTGEQIFERYRSTLKDRDALAGAIEGLVREKEMVASRASEAAARVIGLEDRVQELERRN